MTKIAAAGNYCYAIVDSKSEVYSWGFGENYVLGNREDQNEFKPHKLDPRMFEEKHCLQVACGTQHVVALVQDDKDTAVPAVDYSTFVKVESKVPPKEPKPVKEGEDAEEEDEGPELPDFAVK